MTISEIGANYRYSKSSPDIKAGAANNPGRAKEQIGAALLCYDPAKAESVKKSDREYNRELKKFEASRGYFDYYYNKEDNTTLMEITPGRCEKVFLLSLYRVTGLQEAGMDSDSMLQNYPVYFKRVGNIIQMYAKKLDARSADKSLGKAIERSSGDWLIGSAKISMINSSNGNMIIDLKALIIAGGKGILPDLNLQIDNDNSSLDKPKSFPKNSEITANVVYAPKKEQPSGASFNISYNFSFSELPQSPYRPRLADSRIGYFETSFDNCDEAAKKDRKTQYIQRWNLGKIDPVTQKPERPIVYWVANTVPKNYRDAVKNGIMAWNEAFEKIGIKGAVEVKIQPDDADWDSSDIRYNTVNFVHSKKAYSKGPSQVDPYTGEIYAADVMMSYKILDEEIKRVQRFDKNYLKLTDEKAKKEYLDRCLQSWLVSYTFHEVGHTFGLMHNFKGSLKETNGMSASAMDYNAEDDGAYHTRPGEYDIKAIEYGYKPIDAKTPEEEKKELDKIIKDMYDKGIPYGTDEDLALDPSCNQYDGGNPLEYSKNLIKRAKDLWARLETEFETPGVKYEDLEEIFSAGIKKYKKAWGLACKYIGGVYYRRGNAGDLGGKPPYEPAPAKEQKDALKFLLDEILSPAAFDFKPGLANKLDLNAKQVVKELQQDVLNDLFSPAKLKRISDNEIRYKDDPFKLSDLFEIMNKGVWSEMGGKENISINVFRQNLQKMYVEKLASIANDKNLPKDASILAEKSLTGLKDKIKYLLLKQSNGDATIDQDTKEFLKYILDMLKIY